MTQRRPPRLARWLLYRSGVSIANAPLAGDLYEDFQNGKSTLWFWRQTFTAIRKNGRLTRRNVREWKFLGFLAHLCFVLALWTAGLPREGHPGRWLLLAPFLISIAFVMALLEHQCGWLPLAVRLASGAFAWWTLAYLLVSASDRQSPESLLCSETAWLIACCFDPLGKINRMLKKRLYA